MKTLFVKVTTGKIGGDARSLGTAVAGVLRGVAERLEQTGLSDDAFFNLYIGGMPVGHVGHQDEKTHV